jgi:HAD superfamily hydrolase (TIGR01509 family)
MPAFHTLIFDLDGLMVDTEPLHQRALNLVLEACKAEYQFDRQEYGRLITGHTIFESAEYLRERFGLVQTAQEIAEGHRALFNVLIADAENIEAMPGLRELLAYLDARKIRAGIASSARPEQIPVILRGLNLHHSFGAVVGNDGTLKPKPAPDVYLRAIEQLHAVPAQTIALEDSPSGVRAAHAAGLYVIAVPNAFTVGQDFGPANLIANDLQHVQAWLATQANLN